MPRSKNKREYGFKPVYKEFGPTDHKDTGSVTLDHDEMEAVFLMDSRGLYQDEAAKKMNVSRPTFSRIIKSARFKIATALVSGKQLHINDEKTSLTVMICTAEKNSFHAITPVERYIAFVHINSQDDYSVEFTDNPVVTKGTKPALELPKIAAKQNVNFYISDKAGAGLVNSLLATGVFYEKQNPGFSLQTLVKAFAQTYLSDN